MIRSPSLSELVFHHFEPFIVGGVFTGNFRGMKIRSVSIHPDGVESWGSEYALNGVYTGAAPHLEVGLLAGYQVNDRIFIPVRFLLPFTFLPDRLLLKDFEVDHLKAPRVRESTCGPLCGRRIVSRTSAPLGIDFYS